MSIKYPESEGAIRAFHTFMLASVDIECRDATEQSEFVEGVEYFLAMFRPPKRRGGDRQAQQRRERDEAIRALASLVTNQDSAEGQAREILARLARYRPMADERAPERRLMRQIYNSGLSELGQDRVARIIRSSGKQKT